MIEFFVPKLTAEEFVDLQRLADKAVEASSNYTANGAIVDLLENDTISTAYKMLAVLVNRTWRTVGEKSDTMGRVTALKELVSIRERIANAFSPDVTAPQLADVEPVSQSNAQPTIEEAIKRVYEITVGRLPVPEEINIWKNNFANGLPFHEFLVLMESGQESQQYKKRQEILSGGSDGEFIQAAFELVWSRGAAAWEIENWLRKMEEGSVTRAWVLASIYNTAKKFFTDQANAKPHDGLSCGIMGTGKSVTFTDWERKAQTLSNSPSSNSPMRAAKNFTVKGEPRLLVSALASVYRGGDFIEQFMDNITSQDGFDDYCELVIVDADSPEDEYKTIKKLSGPAQKHQLYSLQLSYRYLRCLEPSSQDCPRPIFDQHEYGRPCVVMIRS